MRWSKIFLLWFGLLQGFGLYSQISVDKKQFDMGLVELGHDRLAEYVVVNNGDKPVYLLRVQHDLDLQTKFSSKTVQAGESEVIRVKYNPTEKGRFKKKLKLYVSSSYQPIDLEITGDVGYIDPSLSPDCPDFTHSARQRTMVSSLPIKVEDANTGIPIAGAQIRIWNSPFNDQKFQTDRNGFKLIESGLGYHSITVDKKDYQTKSFQLNLKNGMEEVVVRLKPVLVEEEEVRSEEMPVVAIQSNKSPVLVADSTDIRFGLVKDEVMELEEINKSQNTIVSTVLPDDNADLVNGGLSLTKFKANNIVFLVDVSTSMGQRERLELLKISVLQMLEVLRSVDKIAIVTYASETNVLLESVSAGEKDRIKKEINSLEAQGFTAGGRGIKEALAVCERNFISGGNNEVIIATDGAFNVNTEDRSLVPTIKKKAKMGIKLSVVGIRNGAVTFESLQNIAERGGGNYVRIISQEDAKRILLNQIMNHSRNVY